MPGPKPKTLAERVWPKIDKTDGCWLWTGMKNWAGYGLIWREPGASKGLLRAHRVVYELLVGPVPEGLELDHRCRVRHCVRPHEDHVVPTTHRINVHRGIGPTAVNAVKQLCDQGHPLTQVAARGDRGCRICINANRRRRLAAHD